MLFYRTNSKVIRLCWVSQSIKAERNRNRVKKLLGIGEKNIDRTDDVKRVHKLSQKKLGRRQHFFQIYHMGGRGWG